ncbi:hypothetical protein OTU49_002069, partial [Cherax quadricarinatus]
RVRLDECTVVASHPSLSCWCSLPFSVCAPPSICLHHLPPPTTVYVMAMTQVDRDGLRDAYSDVRDDKSECNWAVFKYDGSQVIVSAKGETFDDFKAQFGDDERAFAYIRLQA